MADVIKWKNKVLRGYENVEAARASLQNEEVRAAMESVLLHSFDSQRQTGSVVVDPFEIEYIAICEVVVGKNPKFEMFPVYLECSAKASSRPV